MTGKRKSNPLDLPPRMYYRHGGFFYVLKGKWISLGRDLRTALIRANDLAVGDLGEVTPGDYERLFFAAMKSASARRMDWKITSGEWDALVLRANGRCELTGMRFLNCKPAEGRRRPWMPSVDRIDCMRGYVADNVRLVCVAANIARSDFGDEVFRRVAKGARLRDLGQRVQDAAAILDGESREPR